MKKLFLFLLLIIFMCGCSTKSVDENQIDKLLNEWHLAASNADYSGYFDKIAEDGIYIGTDASERWTKNEFIDDYKPYFDKGEAWDFKVIERNTSFSSDKKIAWFDEKLDTWMGVCRGSGVLELIENEWKIKHYHLSVTLPNELSKEFLELTGKAE